MRRRLATVALGAAAAVVVAAFDAGATSAVEAGWWWSPPSFGGVALPLPPPAAEPGELVIATAPGGARAIAAVRATVGPDATAVELQLVTQSELNAASAAIVACPSEGWHPAAGGAWSEHPDGDCERAVAGTRSPDGARWSFALGDLVDDQVVDVVLQPDPATPAATFEVHFAPPRDASFTVTRAVAPPRSTLLPGAVPPATLAPLAPPVDTPLPDLGGITPPSTAPPSDDTPVDLAAPVAATDLAPSGVRRALAALAAVACAAGGTRLRRRDEPVDRLGGISRFARPRTGPAPELT